MTKTVVILGGSVAGLHVAHALLKKNLQDVKVVLVSKNTHFYWNLASVRAIIPGQIKDEDIFQPLETALSRYPADSWELVIGSARAADFDTKTVEIARADNTVTILPYHQLVLATGARSTAPDMPWKASGSYAEALASLHGTAARVADAKHIVVAGAGGTGIEVAGELGYEYGKTKEIILLCSGDKVAGGHGVAAAAANELRKLNVAIKYGARVQETRPAAAEGGGKTEVILANGETLTTDLYLPTTGLVPNTEYIPARFLSADAGSHTVLVDEYLRVLDAENVWACGDVVSKPRAGFFITQKQAASVAKNVEAVLAGLAPAVAKGPPVDIFACAVGRGRGVGRINNSIRMPSIMVWAAKGRTLAVPMVKGYIDGSVA
ncbi:hypothetical protein C8A01DRAFT_34055 [Parachaetomium inaequale]|uniref:FAD/NAD(P)-binding domain-containing protein n=1 Tax=Parachaetomium inaequale TaxID=2588326 RepID=A0AAN6SSW9_9PEZI|nr:hypothetical protein C8A01DRAFT_34055 [Parachaetomium inaequale]